MARSTSSKAPWKRSAPKTSRHTTLRGAAKTRAKRRAKRAGRRYPNLVDNMRAAAEQRGGRAKKTSPGARKRKTSATAPTRSARKKTSARKRKSARPAKKRSGGARAARLKDPRGGLTAAGRKAFARRQGAHLKPGVKKAERDVSPAEMRRKGSWATRFYGRTKTLPPLKDANGRPTRFALTAAAWGEPVPSTPAAARKIAAKGRRLLERYKRHRDR